MRTYHFLILFALLLYGCCSSGQMTDSENQLNIQTEVKNLYSWINLMPGTSDPSIHVTADIEIINKEDFSIKNISLQKIELLSDSTVIELHNNEISSSDDKSVLMKGELKTFNINARKDLKQKISFNKPVVYNFYFISDSGMRKLEVKEVNIERVY